MPLTGPAPQIGADLGRNASTISRELRRGGGWSAYRALAGQAAAVEQARTAHRRARLLNAHPALLSVVGAQLRLRWSPQQISHWLPTTHPDQPELTLATGMAVYFCDPHSPWQRGANENTNDLIRDFFPKETDFATVSAQKLSFVQQALNERLRKTLGWKTPKNAFNQLINQAQLDALAS